MRVTLPVPSEITSRLVGGPSSSHSSAGGTVTSSSSDGSDSTPASLRALTVTSTSAPPGRLRVIEVALVIVTKLSDFHLTTYEAASFPSTTDGSHSSVRLPGETVACTSSGVGGTGGGGACGATNLMLADAMADPRMAITVR